MEQCWGWQLSFGGLLWAWLCHQVIRPLSIEQRMQPGETIVVVGSRGESETFPDGFFKWWKLEQNGAALTRWG
jgi:hypothetical protein